MATIKVSEILIYPIKSTTGTSVKCSELTPKGLVLDRHWALFGIDGAPITARDYPGLLRLTTELTTDGLKIFVEGQFELSVLADNSGDQVPVDVWGSSGTGVSCGEDVNGWFTAFLGVECRLIFMSNTSSRLVSSDITTHTDDVVSYADECPVMLLSQGTLEELNEKLDDPVSIRQFRPNIVVTGCPPGAEDSWKSIRIGDTELDVAKSCKRCNFATLDPTTRKMHEHQEPLRTLSSYRRHPDGGVRFGMLLIPRRLGVISIGDELQILG